MEDYVISQITDKIKHEGIRQKIITFITRSDNERNIKSSMDILGAIEDLESRGEYGCIEMKPINDDIEFYERISFSVHRQNGQTYRSYIMVDFETNAKESMEKRGVEKNIGQIQEKILNDHDNSEDSDDPFIIPEDFE